MAPVSGFKNSFKASCISPGVIWFLYPIWGYVFERGNIRNVSSMGYKSDICSYSLLAYDTAAKKSKAEKSQTTFQGTKWTRWTSNWTNPRRNFWKESPAPLNFFIRNLTPPDPRVSILSQNWTPLVGKLGERKPIFFFLSSVLQLTWQTSGDFPICASKMAAVSTESDRWLWVEDVLCVLALRRRLKTLYKNLSKWVTASNNSGQSNNTIKSGN